MPQIALTQDPTILGRIPAPLPRARQADRVAGMLLGLMIGDSLGNGSESLNPAERHQRFGEIRDYPPNRHAGDRRVGTPSDDSQMALWTLESLLERGRLDPDAFARKFCEHRIYGIGGTVRDFITRYTVEQKPWHEAGPASAGNGALMRIAPMLIPHVADPTPTLWQDTLTAAMLTHNDRASTASCVAFVSLLWDLLGRSDPPDPHWWLERFLGVLRPLEGDDTAYRSRVPGDGYIGPLWRLLEERLPTAFDRGLDARTAGNSWYSGAYLLETVPSALYILMRHGHDPEEAIVRAVNDTRDNDTVAAIVGAAVGALHGRAALPPRWIAGLLGRTRADDDGHAFALIDQAIARWVA